VQRRLELALQDAQLVRMVLTQLPARRVSLVLQHGVDPGQEDLCTFARLDRIELAIEPRLRLVLDLHADLVQLLHGAVNQQLVVRGKQVPDGAHGRGGEAAENVAKSVANEGLEGANLGVKVQVSPLV